MGKIGSAEVRKCGNTKTAKFIIETSLLIAALFVPSFAFASGGTEVPMGLVDWAWKIVNFAILVGLLYVFGWKVIKTHLQQRRELIEKSIKESQEAKQMAAQALAEVEDRLKLKDKEVSDIIAAAVEAGEFEKKRLIEEGERLKLRIVEQAKSNIEFEVKKAKEAIQAEAFETSLRLAEGKIRAKMTQKEQERLLKESIKMIEGKN
jgi:F-type H+-transporting ATPase subunit b